jgi:predicted CXXCH cytochrome family protein
VRRLALLVAGGALWLVLAAIPASADGGPHSLGNNSGTAGLTGDCAACHRAHTAQAAYILTAEEPALCTNCHNGTGATTDVDGGVQFTPATWTGSPATNPILGALRGGGFATAVIDTGNASRMTYNRSGGTNFTLGVAPTSGGFVATFAAIPAISFAGGAVTINPADTVANIQAAVDGLFGTSTLYSGSTAAGNMSGLPAGNRNVIVTKPNATTVAFAYHNAFRTVRVALPAISGNTMLPGVISVTTVDTTTVSATAAIGVRSSWQSVTSTHEGSGTVWGNGAQGATPVGATGVVLDCTGCHNPHGNGQYRILQTTPGAGWANGTNGVANWTPAASAVEVKDGAALTAGQVRNYTVLPGALATDVVAAGYTWTQGDYFRRKFDPSGAANWTNFYLKADEMNVGWNGVAPTNKAANGGVAPANTTGLMTAWCITCHTRYNGWPQNGTSSLVAQTPIDNTYMFKHGTSNIGCEMCHVSHGSNAQMVAGTASANAKFPDGSAEDGALLKVDNRGTCNLCHDPTGTVNPGVFTGSHPAGITPGP